MFALRSRFADLWERLRNSYWFVPSVMLLGAILLASGMVRLDFYLGQREEVIESSFFPGFHGSGARSILTTIASGMVTVTALVFSLTIVSLQLASSQFGPRLLRTFMKSLGNQIVLGTFTSTFIYCLIVVGTVRDNGFVPQVSTATGILLGIIDTGVLIYFIHHVATSIRIQNLIAEVSDDLRAVIDESFPSDIGEGAADRADADEGSGSLGENCKAVCAATAGYVRRIDGHALMAAAREHDLLVRVERSPGDFVVEGDLLFSVWPAPSVNDEVARQVRRSVVLGADRTPTQDLAFAVRQLVEVALRALSPGINDPFTAIECINRLQEGLCIVVQRPRPSAYRFDEEDRLRVIAEPMSLHALAQAAFDPIARAGGANGDVALCLLQAVATVASFAAEPGDRRLLLDFAVRLEGQLQQQLPLERDRNAVAAGFAAALATVSRPSDRQPQVPAGTA